MNFTKISLIAVVLGTLVASTGMAASRASKKIGIGMGFLSDPVPSITSYQLKYNLTPMFQLAAAYGKAGENVTSMGANLKAFVIPSWNFSPYVGAGYTHATVKGEFTLGGSDVDSIDEATSVIYASVGIDHQSNIGFNVGVGANFTLTPTELKDALPMVPHFYFGWFF
jgi:hypothetical protein